MVPNVNKDQIVMRKRLFKLLDEVYSNKIIIIEAPAGFGKSTLVSSWIYESEIKGARWASLEELNQDSKALWNNILEAAGVSKLSNKEYSIDEVISKIQNEIEDEAVLIIDDFQNARNLKFKEEFQYFMKKFLGNIHLILISRNREEMNLARLKLDNKAVEIDERELSFSRNEIEKFIKASGKKIALDMSVNEILKKTQGWIAGIKMLTLSSKKEINYKYIEEFTGEYNLIFDYFAEEVFNGLKENIKDFLVKTSIMETFSVSMCNYVLNIQNAYAVLDMLVSRGLFVASIDEKNTYYKYHSLFKDFLKKHLLTYEEKVRENIYLRIGMWYEAESQFDKSIFYYMKSKNYTSIIRMLESCGMEFLKEGRTVILQNYILEIPKIYLETNSYLCILCAWTYLLQSNLNKIKEYLSKAEKALNHDSGLEEKYYINLIKVISNYIDGNVNENLLGLKKSIGIMKDFKDIQGIIALNLGGGYMAKGEIETAEKWFHQAEILGKNSQGFFIVAAAVRSASTCKLMKGKVEELYDICKDALSYLKSNASESLPAAGMLYITAAEVHLRKYDMMQCEEYIERAYKIGELGKIDEVLYDAHILKSKLFSLKGDYKSAYEEVLMAEVIAERDKLFVRVIEPVEFHKVNVLLNIDISEAFRLMKNKELPTEEICVSNLYVYRAFANIYMHRGLKLKALKVLDAIIEFSSKNNFEGILIEALVHKSALLHSHEELKAAVHNNRALENKLYFYANRTVFNMLKKFKEDQTLIEKEATIDALVCDNDSFKEELTEREIEVLKLIEKGYSNIEIGSDLNISPGTVKRHINNIYSKLGVHTRVQAITFAKKIKVL